MSLGLLAGDSEFRPQFNCSASSAAVNNSVLEDKKLELPVVFGRSSPTVEERFYGW